MAANQPCAFCDQGTDGTHSKAADCIAALKVALLLARRKQQEARAG
jgi:hypothetical protein